MSQQHVQSLLKSFPTTVPAVLCLALHHDCDVSESNMNSISSSFQCPLDIVLTAMDLFRPCFMNKTNITNPYFVWPLGMSMYDDRYLLLADMDAKMIFFIDTFDNTFPTVYKVPTAGVSWVSVNETGRFVVSAKCEMKIYQIMSTEPSWQIDHVRSITCFGELCGVVFLPDGVHVAICMEKFHLVLVVNTDTGDTTLKIESPLFRNPMGICRHPTRRDLAIVSNFCGTWCTVVNLVNGSTVQKINVTDCGKALNGVAIVGNDQLALCFMSSKVTIFSGWNVDVCEDGSVLTETTARENQTINASCLRTLCHGSRLFVSD
eukprot:PhF_6_TR33950/c0_g1_i1/m.49757